MKCLAGMLLLTFAPAALGAVFHVGPGMPYEKPSEVAAVAEDGDVVEIEAADYAGDVAVWTSSNLTIRGIAGRPHLRAAGRSAEAKAIWVVKGDNTVIENIEFSGAAVEDQNGAGIRLEGTNLTIRNCYFHDNENGILTGANPDSEILIEHSEFANNGYGDGYSHNMYIGRVARFTLRFSYVHGARIGHQVKSRAVENRILFNRLIDGHAGTSSYLIDLPDAGIAHVIGNELQQGPRAENWALVHSAQNLVLINNTLVNDRGSGVFVRLSGDSDRSHLQNNLFVGRGELEAADAGLRSNLRVNDAGLVDRRRFDYGLTATSPAIDAGTSVDPSLVPDDVPDAEYRHRAGKAHRVAAGAIDVGAHEFAGQD